MFVAIRFGRKTLIFGQYGQPKPQFHYWAVQCLAYILILLIQKVIITLMLRWKVWNEVRDLLLWPIPASPQLEIALVVLIIPFTVNVFIFWVTDNFLTMSRSLQPKLPAFVNSQVFCNQFRRFKRSVLVSVQALQQPAHPQQKLYEEDDDQLVEISLEQVHSTDQPSTSKMTSPNV